jgi:hypothetical protein
MLQALAKFMCITSRNSLGSSTQSVHCPEELGELVRRDYSRRRCGYPHTPPGPFGALSAAVLTSLFELGQRCARLNIDRVGLGTPCTRVESADDGKAVDKGLINGAVFS